MPTTMMRSAGRIGPSQGVGKARRRERPGAPAGRSGSPTRCSFTATPTTIERPVEPRTVGSKPAAPRPGSPGWARSRPAPGTMLRMSRRRSGGVPGDALTAGLAGAACSAIPSTAWSLVRGDDVLEGGRATGAMLLPHERRTAVLLAAAAPVHLAISIGWAAVMATALPRGREPAWGVVGALMTATVDLALIGRRIPSIATLPQGRQW